MDKDLLKQLRIAYLDHKDVEYEEDWLEEDLLEEKLGLGFSKSFLESHGHNMKEKNKDDLYSLISEWNPSKTILYVGGTTRKDPKERGGEHERKKFKKMTSFYYCFVQDVKHEETVLLDHGGKNVLKENAQFTSNCKAEKGYVYVLDTGLISK